MHELVHEDADDVAVAIADVLVLTIHIVRTEDDVVQTEHVARSGEIHFHGELGHTVRILRHRTHVLAHGRLQRTVDRNAAGEHKALHTVLHAGVDEVDAAYEVVLVVEAADEMAEAFSSIRSQVIHVGELVLGEELLDEFVVVDGALHEGGARIHLIGKAAAEVIERNDGVAHGQQFLHEVGTHETGASGNERYRHASDDGGRRCALVRYADELDDGNDP